MTAEMIQGSFLGGQPKLAAMTRGDYRRSLRLHQDRHAHHHRCGHRDFGTNEIVRSARDERLVEHSSLRRTQMEVCAAKDNSN
jgi:hypothetical protein